MSKLDNLKACNLRVICVAITQTDTFACCYRVYTSDGGFSDYIGYNAVPETVKEWMKERNTWEYVIPSCMLISGMAVV